VKPSIAPTEIVQRGMALLLLSNDRAPIATRFLAASRPQFHLVDSMHGQ
jgi:hypothetical protein